MSLTSNLVVQSGVILVKELAESALRHHLDASSISVPLAIVYDEPWGYALKNLENPGFQKIIVITSNVSPEYLADLYELNPFYILSSHSSFSTLLNLVKLSQSIQPPHLINDSSDTSLLTPAERKILRACAFGLSSKEIAKQNNITLHSVSNHLNHIYKKLRIEGRSQAILYYWGMLNPETKGSKK